MAKQFNLIFVFILLISSLSYGQSFTIHDTLRGSITPEREWWDLTHYHLDIRVNPESRTIKGSNKIRYKVLSLSDQLQIDLQEPLKITKIVQKGMSLEFHSVGDAHFSIVTKSKSRGHQ